MTVQLEYINHLLQFFKNISYYTGIMLNAFSDLLCPKLCWHNRLVPAWNSSDEFIALEPVIPEDLHKKVEINCIALS